MSVTLAAGEFFLECNRLLSASVVSQQFGSVLWSESLGGDPGHDRADEAARESGTS
jgi:hypothetical protein